MIYKVRVPTNIAFLKYWGKSNTQEQWPANDSLSMTLDLCTETLASLHALPEKNGTLSFHSLQELSETPHFLHKGLLHLQFLAKEFAFDKKLYLQTYNEFPSSCGIASSASGLASLTLAALCCWTESSSFEELEEKGFSRERIAHLSRLGSGSACRSLWGGFVLWQRGEKAQDQKVGPLAQTWALRDCVVILSDEEKSVSSTEGHRYASTSPLFEKRLIGIPERLRNMKEAIEEKNLEKLGPLLEEEALNMHEVMASSTPSCVYMTNTTFDFLEYLVTSRREFGIPMYFTLDAGPNVHVIYEEATRERVEKVLEEYKTIDVRIGSDPEISLLN